MTLMHQRERPLESSCQMPALASANGGQSHYVVQRQRLGQNGSKRSTLQFLPNGQARCRIPGSASSAGTLPPVQRRRTQQFEQVQILQVAARPQIEVVMTDGTLHERSDSAATVMKSSSLRGVATDDLANRAMNKGVEQASNHLCPAYVRNPCAVGGASSRRANTTMSLPTR